MLLARRGSIPALDALGLFMDMFLMENETNRTFEQEYEERFEWRKARQIENLKELSEIAHSGWRGFPQRIPRLETLS